MNGIENARHDLFEAACSLETAIELLASVERDSEPSDAFRALVHRLNAVKEELDDASARLPEMDVKSDPTPPDALA